jgi:hypothetical protein
MLSTTMVSFMDNEVIVIVEADVTNVAKPKEPSSYLMEANATNLSPKISTLMIAILVQ